MADYIKREDALNASKLVYIEFIELDDEDYDEADCDKIPIVLKRDLEAIPSADVVEVVRCKDCAFSDLRQITDEGHTVRVCEIWGYVDDTHFCNDGRWRDDDV